MKFISSLLIIIALSLQGIYAQTLISGTLPSSTTWTKVNSPYQLTGSVTLNAGDTLTIEPGVEIQFNHYTYILTINGTLNSVGLSNDSIKFHSASIGGRIVLSSTSHDSEFGYCYFEKLGSFNNAAIIDNGLNDHIHHSTFNTCEVGVYVNNGANTLIELNDIGYSNDYGIQVINGYATILNNSIHHSFATNIYLTDNAYITGNNINNSGTGTDRAGIHIDANINPYIDGNTFSNSMDILTHPAVVNDTMFDNNGVSRIYIDNKTIGQTTIWHKPTGLENWDLAITGDVTVNTGDSLTIEPGLEVVFLHYTADLLINGSLISQGSKLDSIMYRGNNLGGRIVLSSVSNNSIIEYCRFNGLGSFNNPAIAVSSSSLIFQKNRFNSCEVAATFYSGASPIVDSCTVVSSSDWGFRVENGTPTIQNCIISSSFGAGIYLLDTAIILNNVITNTGGGFGTGGIVIYEKVYPYINNNVFSGNKYADIITHPAVVDDTLFDNNGISVIHIRNTTITETTTWHEPVLPEDWYYVLMGPITVAVGDSLTIEPGVDLVLQHYTTDLNIGGTLVCEGTLSDSIIIRGNALGGRLQIYSTGIADFKYVRFNKLGAFNNPGLAVHTDLAKINRCYFNQCEVGISVYSGAEPLVDSCEFYKSADYGMRVFSGNPIITNNLFDENRQGGILMVDTAYIQGNNFINNGFQQGYAAIHIDAVVHPFIDNNTFSNNAWDILTHPAVMNDTTFDNNGLSLIHIDNKSIGESTVWHAPVPPENWEYSTTGDITLDPGDSLTIEPGFKLNFRHYTDDLHINGYFTAKGTESDSIVFKSSFGGRLIMGSASVKNELSYCKFNKLGAANLPATAFYSLGNVTHSEFSQCEVGIQLLNSATVTVDSSLFNNSTDYAVKVSSGNFTITNSCIFDNSYGIVADTGTSVIAQYNWWGDATGPFHVTNSSGLGDQVSNDVDFSNWLMSSPCDADPGPMLVTLHPLHNAINVPVGTNLKAHFNEDIQKGSSGKIKVLRSSDDFVLYDQDITQSSIVVQGDSLEFLPGLLPDSTLMYVTIDSNAIQNLNNTAFPGINNNLTWEFLTEPDLDNDGFTVSQGDCDDLDSLEFPGQNWFADTDNDGFGDVNSKIIQCLRPLGFILDSTDCDDTNPLEFPGQVWYADLDNDGYGDLNNKLTQCLQPPGYLLDSADCDDTDSLQFPGQKWFADSDNDNFGDVNNWLIQCLQPTGYVLDSTDCDDTDSLLFPGQRWFADNDKDGFGDQNNLMVQCLQPPGFILDSTDCDDMDSLLFPSQVWYADNDGDSFGDKNNFLIQCTQPAGYILDTLDCDDTDSLEFPGQKWYADNDGDQFGDSLNFLIQCERPIGYILENTDCNDMDSTIYPGAIEILDSIDNNCDGIIDEGFFPGIASQKESFIKMYPNPVKNKLYFKKLNNDNEAVEIEILDLNGRRCKFYRFSDQILELDISTLPSALYFVRLLHQGDVHIKKLVIE